MIRHNFWLKLQDFSIVTSTLKDNILTEMELQKLK